MKSSPRDEVAESEPPGVTGCISTLRTLLINTDPSPSLLSTVFTPIASALYAIHECLNSKKTADPGLRETVEGLLGTWFRIVSTQEVEQVCWDIVEGEGGYWKVDIAGGITQAARYLSSRVPGGHVDLTMVLSQARGYRKSIYFHSRDAKRS